MNNAYMIYQAERTMTAAEQRAADRRNGELAAYLAGVWHSLTAPLRFRRRNHRGHQPGWRITAPGPASASPGSRLCGPASAQCQ